MPSDATTLARTFSGACSDAWRHGDVSRTLHLANTAIAALHDMGASTQWFEACKDRAELAMTDEVSL